VSVFERECVSLCACVCVCACVCTCVCTCVRVSMGVCAREAKTQLLVFSERTVVIFCYAIEALLS